MLIACPLHIVRFSLNRTALSLKMGLSGCCILHLRINFVSRSGCFAPLLPSSVQRGTQHFYLSGSWYEDNSSINDNNQELLQSSYFPEGVLHFPIDYEQIITVSAC